MITPRQTRLYSTPDLSTFQHTIAGCLDGPSRWNRRASVVLVPSRAAADQLRWTLERLALERDTAVPLPHLLTRDELYAELHSRAGDVPPDAEARVSALMTGEERARHDHRHVASEAAAIYVRALARPDVATLVGGDCLFEVPFSMRRDDVAPERGVVIVRGTIVCLHRWSDGRLTVFELKTGRVRSHHERQLAFYVDAARALCPDAAVNGKVIYL